MAKKICITCGKQIPFLEGIKLIDGTTICSECEKSVIWRSDNNKVLSSYIMKLKRNQFESIYNNPDLQIQDFFPEKEMREVLIQRYAKSERCDNCKMVLYGMFDKITLADGKKICRKCWTQIAKRSSENESLMSNVNKMTLSEFKDLYTNESLGVKDFIHDKEEICGVEFDNTTQTIDFTFGNLLKAFVANEEDIPTPIAYSSVVKYEYKEGETTITKGGSGLGRAIVGGILINGTAAIVGAMTKKRSYDNVISDMTVLITFNIDGETYFKCIKVNGRWDKAIKYGSPAYIENLKQAQKLMAKLDDIYYTYHKDETPLNETVESCKQVYPEDVRPLSAADEIRKFKELLDDGIISQEEFQQKKKQLLGID